MSEVEPITHLLALGVIILVSGFFAVMAFGMACAKQMYDDIDDDIDDDCATRNLLDPEPGEIDTTYYPDDDEDNVIFRR